MSGRSGTGVVLASYGRGALVQSGSETLSCTLRGRKQHGSSGLTERVLASRVDAAAAERRTLEFLEKWVEIHRSPMCGNSICQDRRFLARYMPTLERFFHYRNLDVSTLKELAQRWAPHIAAAFHKNASHLAQDDVRESIRELEYYREHLLRPLGAPAA